MSGDPEVSFRHTPYGEARSVEMLPGVVRRTLAVGERMLLVEITLQAGGTVPPHSHPHEQIGYLIKGRLQFEVDDRQTIVEAGGGYCIPGGVTHSAVALEDSVAVEVFSPVREEYR